MSHDVSSSIYKVSLHCYQLWSFDLYSPLRMYSQNIHAAHRSIQLRNIYHWSLLPSLCNILFWVLTFDVATWQRQMRELGFTACSLTVTQARWWQWWCGTMTQGTNHDGATLTSIRAARLGHNNEVFQGTKLQSEIKTMKFGVRVRQWRFSWKPVFLHKKTTTVLEKSSLTNESQWWFFQKQSLMTPVNYKTTMVLEKLSLTNESQWWFFQKLSLTTSVNYKNVTIIFLKPFLYNHCRSKRHFFYSSELTHSVFILEIRDHTHVDNIKIFDIHLGNPCTLFKVAWDQWRIRGANKGLGPPSLSILYVYMKKSTNK